MISIISNKRIVGCQTVCINQIQCMLEHLSSAESFLIVTERDTVFYGREPLHIEERRVLIWVQLDRNRFGKQRHFAILGRVRHQTCEQTKKTKTRKKLEVADAHVNLMITMTQFDFGWWAHQVSLLTRKGKGFSSIESWTKNALGDCMVILMNVNANIGSVMLPCFNFQVNWS